MTTNLIWILFIALVVCSVIIIVSHSKSDNYHHKIEHIQKLVPCIEKERIRENEKTIEEQPHVSLLNDLITEYRLTKNPAVLVAIGDFYRRGMYSVMKSNNSEALKYYELASKCNDRNIVEIARVKHAEANDNPIPEIDDIGIDLPENALFETIAYEPFVDIVEPPQNNLFMNDLQNVHDHYVSKISESNINKLKELVTENLVADVKTSLMKDLYKSDFNDYNIAVIIDVIKAFDDSAEQYKITPLQCLQLVYSYIQTQPNKEDLTRNLFLQLLDCKENGFIVCVTGKIARVLSVLSILDDFEEAKNIYYIKPELEQLAIKVRDDVLSTLSEDEVNSYNTNGDGSDKIVETMKREYTTRVNDEYCVKLGISNNIIAPHVEANLSAF